MSQSTPCVEGTRITVNLAERRVSSGEQQGELASIKFWREAKAAKLDAELRASIAGLNGVCSLFDYPKIFEVFVPDPIWKKFGGFGRLVAEGSRQCPALPGVFTATQARLPKLNDHENRCPGSKGSSGTCALRTRAAIETECDLRPNGPPVPGLRGQAGESRSLPGPRSRGPRA